MVTRSILFWNTSSTTGAKSVSCTPSSYFPPQPINPTSNQPTAIPNTDPLKIRFILTANHLDLGASCLLIDVYLSANRPMPWPTTSSEEATLP